MRSILRWCARHRLLAKILLIVLICGAYTWMISDIDAPIWAFVVLNGALIFIINTYVDACGQYLLKKPLKILKDQCNPYPFLEETQELLGYSNSKAADLALRINHAMAMREIGDFQHAWAILSTIHIDQLPGTLPSVKVVYYNNLADVLTLLDRFDEAEIWSKKALEIYHDMPNNKFKRELGHAMEVTQADHYYRDGDYRRAMENLDQISHTTLHDQVNYAWLYARCCIALGENQKAKEKLLFIIQNGNKLWCVDWAQECLQNIGD